MTLPAPAYDAFISYRRSDGARVANWLRRELQAFRAPKSIRVRFPGRLRIYLDTAFERGTSDFYDQSIRPALLGSRFLLVIATPDAIRRPGGATDWIAREVADFSAGPNGRNVIAVRAGGEFADPLPADLAERFPNIEIVDLRGAGPLWFLNPFRAVRLGNEKLKLVAPLIGLPADEMPSLRQEEERRQQSRLGAMAGVTLGVVAAVSLLSVYALQSRWRAEQALESSLFSTGRMVTAIARGLERDGAASELRRALVGEGCDLIDKLRREALREARVTELVTCLVERALERERQRETALATQGLAAAIALASTRYAEGASVEAAHALLHARRTLIEVLERRGDWSGMEAALSALSQDAGRFWRGHDSFPDFALAQAEAEAMLAVVHKRSGRIDDAITALTTAVRLAEAAAAEIRKSDRARADRQVEWQAQLLSSIGELHAERGALDEALAQYRRSLALRDAVRLRGPEQLRVEIEAAATQARIAAVELKRGNKAEAEQAAADARKRIEWAARAPELDATMRRRVAEVRRALGPFDASPPDVGAK